MHTQPEVTTSEPHNGKFFKLLPLKASVIALPLLCFCIMGSLMAGEDAPAAQKITDENIELPSAPEASKVLQAPKPKTSENTPPPKANAPKPEKRKNAKDKKINVTMQNISLKSCIEILAQQLKMEYLIAPNVKTDKLISVRVGNINDWSMADKEKLLDAILAMSGVQRVKRGEVWIFRAYTGERSLINNQGAQADDAEPVIGITQVKNIRASEAVKLLNKLSQTKPVQAYNLGRSNSLIIASTASYYRHVLQMLEEIDHPEPVDGMLNVEQIIRRVCKDMGKQFIIEPTVNTRTKIAVMISGISKISNPTQQTEMFDAILSGLGINRIERDGVWFFSQSYPGMEGSGFGSDFDVETISLKYINARSALSTLKGMLNPHPVKGGVVKESNQLVVMVPKGALEGLKKAVEQIDQPKLPHNNATVAEVIAYFCSQLNKPYIISPMVNNRYRMNLMIPEMKGSTEAEKLNTFDAILTAMGVQRTERDGVWEFGSSTEAKVVGDEVAQKLRASEPVIGVYRLKHIQGRMVYWILSRLTDYPAKIYNVWGQQSIVIITTAANYQKVIKVIESLDKQSSVIKSFELKYSEAQDVARELSNIFRYHLRTNYRPIEFVPIARMNTVVVRNAKPEDLPLIAEWVQKLDNADTLDKRVTKVYHLQYEDAKNVAAVLSRLYRDVHRMIERQKKQYNLSTRNLPDLTGFDADEQNNAEIAGTPADEKQPIPKLTPGENNEEMEGAGNYETVILADTNTNSVVVNATLSTHKEITKIIQQLDGKRKQVLIEVTLVEVTLDDTTKHGVEWLFKAPKGAKVNTTGSFGYNKDFLPRYNADWDPIPSGKDIFLAKDGFSYLIEASDQVMAAISVAESDNRMQVISSPSILAREDKTATVSFGEEVPIRTTTMNDNVTEFSYNYRDAKIKLEVTPHINDGGIVTLELKQEMNSLDRASYETNPQAPIFTTRTIQSEFQVADNQTLVLGGLIEKIRSRNNDGIAFVKKIPVIKLFTSNETKIKYTREIIVILTPRIIKNRDNADCITRSYRDNIMNKSHERNYPGLNFLTENKDAAEILFDEE